MLGGTLLIALQAVVLLSRGGGSVGLAGIVGVFLLAVGFAAWVFDRASKD